MKLRTLCKSKIHHAVVTDADVNYVGSIGVDDANRFVQRLDVLGTSEDALQTADIT